MNEKNQLHESCIADCNDHACELRDDELSAVTGAGDAKQRVPGVQCPRCNAFIPVTIAELLHMTVLRCPTCQLEMDVSKQKLDLNS